VQRPSLRHAVRALLVVSAGLAMAGAAAVPASASTIAPDAVKAVATKILNWGFEHF
jgi:hypothetical protein